MKEKVKVKERSQIKILIVEKTYQRWRNYLIANAKIKIYKFHDVIKSLSIKEEIHFTE